MPTSLIILSATIIAIFLVFVTKFYDKSGDKKNTTEEHKDINTSKRLDSDLGELLNKYEEKKREQKIKEEERRNKEKRLKEISVNAIKEIIIPVLEEIEKSISKKGYWCSVKRDIEGRIFPYVELKFKPEEGLRRNSSIRFEHSKPCEILMREKIKKEDFNGREEKVEVDNLKVEWVEKQTTVFIENALKEY